jgi:hypothetical protein
MVTGSSVLGCCCCGCFEGDSLLLFVSEKLDDGCMHASVAHRCCRGMWRWQQHSARALHTAGGVKYSTPYVAHELISRPFIHSKCVWLWLLLQGHVAVAAALYRSASLLRAQHCTAAAAHVPTALPGLLLRARMTAHALLWSALAVGATLEAATAHAGVKSKRRHNVVYVRVNV